MKAAEGAPAIQQLGEHGFVRPGSGGVLRAHSAKATLGVTEDSAPIGIEALPGCGVLGYACLLAVKD